MQEDSATLALNPLVVCERQCHVMHYSCHARWCHDMRMSFIIQKSMKTNMYLQGRIEIDASLCECLTNFCNSGESDTLLLLYLSLTEEIYKMGCNAELTVHFWDQGSSIESNSIAPSSRTSKPAYVKPKECANANAGG